MKEEIAAANLSFLGPSRVLLFARELPYCRTPRSFRPLPPTHAQEDDTLAPGTKKVLKSYSRPSSLLAWEVFQHC